MYSEIINNRLSFQKEQIEKLEKIISDTETKITELKELKAKAVNNNDVEQGMTLESEIRSATMRLEIANESLTSAKSEPPINEKLMADEWKEYKKPMNDRINKAWADAEKAYNAYMKALNNIIEINKEADKMRNPWIGLHNLHLAHSPFLYDTYRYDHLLYDDVYGLYGEFESDI